MEFTKSLMLAAIDGSLMSEIEENGVKIKIIERSEWTQNYKMQDQETIFECCGKYYSIVELRSGSPFTDWHYESEYWGAKVKANEVEKIEVKTHVWKAVQN